MLEDFRAAMWLVFRSGRYRITAGGFAILLFAIYVSVPVWTIPGNSYGTYFSVVPRAELASTAALSAAMGIVLAMQAYAWKHKVHSASHAGAGIAGLISGSISAVFSTASCASCMSAVFSFLGFSGVVFFIQHRNELMALTFIVLGVSLYLTSRRIARGCASCGVPDPKEAIEG